MQELFVKAGQLIGRSQKILCIAHRKPDGDSLGTALAFHYALTAQGRQVDLACIDEPASTFAFLPGIKKFRREIEPAAYDLLIVCDAGASYMTKYHEIHPTIFDGSIPVINIDHHASNDNFGTLNIVDVNSASTTLLLYKMLRFLELKITPEMATCLICGIYNDTGALMHSNTNLEVFEITGRLVELGGNIQAVAKNLFKTTPVNRLRVWGRAMERATVNEQGVVVTVVTQADLEEVGANSEDLGGLVDFLNSVPGSKFTVLLNEDEKGNVKGSFRTRRDDVDVAELAGRFGGGGHKKAAGFTMPGRIHQEIRWKVAPLGEPVLDAPQGSGKAELAPQELLSNILQIPEVKVG